MPVPLPPGLMVSVSGFRGRVGEALTPELVTALAAAFGTFLRREGAGDTVLLARDSRTSGPMLSRSAAAGLVSVGCSVVDLGMVSTPTLLLAVEDAGAAGGIGVTASHNPAEWNALKLVSGEGIFLDGDTMDRFLQSLDQDDVPRASWDGLGSVRQDGAATARHVRRILELPLLDVDAIRARAFRVALDCVRGAGGTIMPPLLEALGCRVEGIHLEPDGHFPRDPEPTARNLGELGRAVTGSAADIGLAVDPDVDRLSLVDERGEPMGEDLTLALAADAVLRRRPGPVVTNLSTSQALEDVARAHGSHVVRAPVGEVNVARKMQQVGAVVGGEGNGGVILPDLHYTRDAPLAAALVLQELVDLGATPSAAAGRWPTYRIVKDKVALAREALPSAFRALREQLPPGETDVSDGLRVAWPHRRAWLHVRASGTEPVIRLIAEAPDEGEARALVEQARACLGAVGTHP